MPLPQPDESAYSGDIVVKSVTYGKSNKSKTTGLSIVKKTIASLELEAEKRLTIDRLDPNSAISVQNQLIINKEICALLRKESLRLTTFLKNN